MVIFITEIVIFLKASKWNELQENGFRMKEFQKYFFTIFTWPNGPVRAKILPRFQLEGKTDVRISQVSKTC